MAIIHLEAQDSYCIINDRTEKQVAEVDCRKYTGSQIKSELWRDLLHEETTTFWCSPRLPQLP